MVQAPPSSDSEDSQEDLRESGGVRDYQYESEGEELLGTGARALLHRARGDYRLARAALLAYTREDIVYLPPPRRATQVPCTPALPPSTSLPCAATTRHPLPPSHTSLLTTQPSSHTRSPINTLVTPPPTSSASRRPRTVRMTASLSGPSPEAGPASQSPHNRVATNQPRPSNEQRSHQIQHPSGVSRPPTHQYLTVLHPHLRQTGMAGYFKIEDAVSYRSPEVVEAMLTQIKRNPEWLGDASCIDATAVDSSDTHVIHEPAPNTTAEVWYAVSAGTQVGVFASWLLAGAYTQGISFSVHRSFKTRMAAYRSFQLALVLGTVRLLPAP